MHDSKENEPQQKEKDTLAGVCVESTVLLVLIIGVIVAADFYSEEYPDCTYHFPAEEVILILDDGTGNDSVQYQRMK